MDGNDNITLTVYIDMGGSTSTMADGAFGVAFFAATCNFNRDSRDVLTTMVFVEDGWTKFTQPPADRNANLRSEQHHFKKAVRCLKGQGGGGTMVRLWFCGPEFEKAP
jgi:hypothetical protein